MTSALPPPPRQSLSPADSSSQTCQSHHRGSLFTNDLFFIQKMTPEIICSNFALALTVKSIFVIVIVLLHYSIFSTRGP